MTSGEEVFTLMFRRHPIPMWIYDIETLDFLDLNDAAIEKYGYNRKEFLNMTITDIRPAEDVAGLLHDVAKIQWELQHSGEWRHKLKDGRTIDVEITSQTLEYGGHKAALLVAQDITERKRYEEALAASEMRYHRLFEAAKDGILILDAETGVVVDVNPFLIQLLGYSHEQLIGKTVWELGFLKDKIANQVNFLELKKKGYVRYEDMPLESSDGRRIDVEFVSNVYEVDHQHVIQCNIRDITERKRSEDALRESEERFSVLADASFEGIVISDTGRIIELNEQMAGMLGYERKELIGRTVESFVAPESLELVQEHIKSGNEEPYAHLSLRKDGSTFPVEIRAKSIPYKGRVVRVTTVRDITERKRAEEAIRESEERFRMVFENVFDGISIYSEDPEPSERKLVECNERYAAMAGRSREELLKLGTTQGLQKPLEDSVDSSRLRALHSMTVYRGSFSWLRPDGKDNVIEYIGMPITWRGKSYSIGIDRDITERKKAEESHLLLTTALESTANGVTITDLQGNIVWVNKAFTLMTGFSSAEAVGQNPRILKSGRQASSFYKDLWETISVGNVWTGELINKKKDGSLYTDEMTITPLKNKNGETTNFIAIKQDVTERKQAENELERYRSQLERFSERLENTLDEERKRISRELHDELGQLLTVLKFDLSWLASNSKMKDKQLSDKLESMEGTMSQALASVKRISKELRPPQLDALGIIGAIQLDLNQMERKVGLTTHLEIEPAEFLLDKQLSIAIYRVCNEVLTNVVRHARAKSVSIILTKTHDAVDLKVQDDGQGITKRELEGTKSLGIVGMRERVRQWQGTLTINGSKGKGTTVTAHFLLKRNSLEGSNS